MEQSIPAAAQVIVVGGGAMGCSTAYHLAKFGCRDVILLEREKLTSGTTWHAAGLVRQLRATANLTSLIRYGASLYASLEAETGQSTGWRQTGSLSVAAHPDRFIHIKRMASLARMFGLEADVVDIHDVRRLWPLCRTDDLVGAVWSPSDGRVNPSDLCAAYAKGARMHGARIFEGVKVTGVRVRNGRVAGVDTNHGPIASEVVVNCAGLWARQVAGLAGAIAPLHACYHYYLLTKPMRGIEGHLPTLSAQDEHLYVRDDVGGLLVGCFEPHAKALPLEKLPENFAFDLMDEDWDHFEPILKGAIHRIPALETAEARMLLVGPESFTPDERFLLGESAELKGFFVGGGMNSVGIATSAGAGKALAEWILAGEPTMDLWQVDIRRFAPFHNNIRALRERAPETLAVHHYIPYPGRQHETVRNLRLSPLHERLAAKGAEFHERAGWERPVAFRRGRRISFDLTFGRPGWLDASGEEHRAAREATAVFDQTSFAKLLVQGRDAERVLQSLCANDVAAPVRRIVYTAMLNPRGGYESDLTVMRWAEDAFLLVTGAAQGVRDALWIRRHLGPDDFVTVTDVTSAYAVLGVMGPRSRELLTRADASGLDNDSHPYLWWRDVEIGHSVVRAARVTYVGELGWELYAPTEFARNVYDALHEAGADLGLLDAGYHALNSLRIEKGYRAWGAELSPDETPFEAGLGFAVKLDKGDFVGREALLAKKSEGPPRKRLLQFKAENPDAFLHGGEPIVWRGRYVGQVTSAAFGHTIGRPVAMGYVRAVEDATVADMVEAGGFEAEMALQRCPLTASFSAFYDPKGERLRA